MKKCTKTLSGEHIWDQSFSRGTGVYKTRMEDISPIMHQVDMQKVEYEVTVSYDKCGACGMINDLKENQ